MKTFEVEVLNPKAIKLLKCLAELELITLKKIEKPAWESVLKNLRKHADSAPSLEEITKEVEIVRAEMYKNDPTHR